jgi:hypothetical protein
MSKIKETSLPNTQEGDLCIKRRQKSVLLTSFDEVGFKITASFALRVLSFMEEYHHAPQY